MILVYRLRTPASADPGWPSARTSWRPRPTASTPSPRSCWRSRSARRPPGSPASSTPPSSTLVSPDLFRFTVSFTVLAMVVLGGMGNIWGVAVGAFVIYMIQTVLLKQLNMFFDNVQVPILERHRLHPVPVPALRHRPGRDDAAAARGPVPEPAAQARAAHAEEDAELRRAWAIADGRRARRATTERRGRRPSSRAPAATPERRRGPSCVRARGDQAVRWPGRRQRRRLRHPAGRDRQPHRARTARARRRSSTSSPGSSTRPRDGRRSGADADRAAPSRPGSSRPVGRAAG